MLAVTGRKPAFVSDLKATRFANDALDALAICGPSPKASLDAALREIGNAGGLIRSHGILISTRPDYCRLAVADLFCAEAELLQDRLNRGALLGLFACHQNERFSHDLSACAHRALLQSKIQSKSL